MKGLIRSIPQSIFLLQVGCWLLTAGSAQAQIVTDGSLGAATSLGGTNVVISPTLGRQSGANLFHSFSTFNVAAFQSARFDSVAGTANIVARVTGGTASQINGALLANTNLFLLNPQGIMFGSGASINIAGSFHASTADYVRFSDNTVFYVNPNTGGTSFSTAAPTAFGFLDNSVGAITVTGSVLANATGRSFSLVGGDITLTNTFIQVPQGRFNLASVASAGEVVLGANTMDANGFGAMGNIRLNQSVINANDTQYLETANVFIRGGRLVMDGTSGIVGETVIAGTPHIIDIGVDSLLLQNGSGIDFESFGTGASTNAIIRARQIEIIGNAAGDPTGILVGGGGANPSGNIFITADSVRVQGSGTVLGTGAVFGTGRAGDINITANSLSVTDGGAVIALSATSGNAGSIIVNADTVFLANRGSILSSNTGTGNGGPISIDARLITLENHGVITSSSLGTGNAGNIWLRARDSISLASGSVISTQAKQGAGGNIAIIAGNKLLLRESSISTSVDGPASNGGNIDIDPVFVVLDNSRILARAVGGNGGNINISTQYLLQSTDSVIDASSQLGVNGRVVIAGTDVDLDSDLAPLPSNFLNAKQWLSAACVNRQGNDVSQFTVNGRDGVYRSSSDFALSPMMFDALPAAASIEGSAAGYVDSRWAAATLLTQSPVWLRPACSHDPG